MLVIVDYGMGNLRSVEKAFKRIDASPIVSSKKEDILNASKLVLPGVGYFKSGMERLKELDLIEALNEKVINQKTPILGICLGMQLFTEHSEEGDVNGLGWITAKTKAFKLEKLKIPHMGWNSIKHNNQPIFEGISTEDTFYFVHSFYVQAEDESQKYCSTNYGIDFHSGIGKEHIIGVQFHPEKSHSTGLKLLTNFMNNY